MVALTTLPSALVTCILLGGALLKSTTAFSPTLAVNFKRHGENCATEIGAEDSTNDDDAYRIAQEQQLAAALMQQRPPSQSSEWWSPDPNDGSSSLPFDCTGCGKCCKTKGNVWLSPAEATAAADFLSVTEDTFVDDYASNTLTDGRSSPWIQLKNSKEGPCVFLDLETNQCQIYSVRPIQCSTYPFWPNVMKSQQSWNEEVRLPDNVVQADHDPIPYWTEKVGGCEGMKRVADVDGLLGSEPGVPIAEAAAQLADYEWFQRRFPSQGEFTPVEDKQ